MNSKELIKLLLSLDQLVALSCIYSSQITVPSMPFCGLGSLDQVLAGGVSIVLYLRPM